MRRCVSVAVAVLLCAVLASAAGAANQTHQGDIELSLGTSGRWLDIEDVDFTHYQLALDVGTFVTDRMEIGLEGDFTRLELGYEDIELSGDLWQMQGVVAYHMATESQTVPYGVARFGIWDVEDIVDSEFLWGVGVGFKHYSSPDRFWKVELAYQDSEVEDVSVSGFGLRVAMGFRFPADRREEPTTQRAAQMKTAAEEAAPAPVSDWQPRTEW